jgi:DNA-directed RNA polymerase subunit F
MTEPAKDIRHIEQLAAAHLRLMRLINPATARDWMEELRKEDSKLVSKETRKVGS